jgi:hypothetical protein
VGAVCLLGERWIFSWLRGFGVWWICEGGVGFVAGLGWREREREGERGFWGVGSGLDLGFGGGF